MENRENHLLDVLKLINNLQRNSTNDNTINNSCLRPILGLNQTTIFNTRPVSFYLCNGNSLTVNYTQGEQENTSTIFRVESINGNCVTVRLLSEDEGVISATSEYATVNMSCIAAIRCLSDISIAL